VDYQDPQYSAIFARRAKKLKALRADPKLLAAVKVHYRTHPWDFISDWGMTFEPRNVERGLISSIPFILWPKQEEYLKWLYRSWRSQERGLVEKSRDCGVTWLSVGFAVSMWCFEDGFTTGFGSRKEELVDKRGDSKCIFEKVRFFIDNLPEEFMPDKWEPRTCSAHMRIVNPDNNAAIIGESGNEIGRGGRASIYIVDEAAFVERQEQVDAALSQNTNCQIDISTPNGNGNLFYKKRQRFNGTDKIFIFDWRDDPRKDEAWYQKQVEEQDEVTVAQEIDRDYNASAEDVFIPSKWVKAAIDAHKKLGFEPTGIKVTSFDPADVGDAKAVVNRQGSVIQEAKQMKKGDITDAMPWAMSIGTEYSADVFIFDADGMGAPSMKLFLVNNKPQGMKVLPFYGSGEVDAPNDRYGADENGDKLLKINKDAFLNYRAQTWTWARDRFKATYEAIQRQEKGLVINVDPEKLISIDSECESLHELVAELSRPKRKWTNNGKIKVESKIDMRTRGVDSPNLADDLVMAVSVKRPKIKAPVRMRPRRMTDRAIGY
jgi:hypothetical protein